MGADCDLGKIRNFTSKRKMIPGRIRSRVSKLGKEHPELGEAGQLVWSVLLFRNSSSVMLDTCP